MDPLVEAFQAEGYEVDVFPGPVMKHAVAVPDPFILQISCTWRRQRSSPPEHGLPEPHAVGGDATTQIRQSIPR